MTTVQVFTAPPAYEQVGDPTKLPGPLTMLAVAVPAPRIPLIALTVIVSVWFVPTGFVAVGGAIWMFAFTQVLVAFGLFAPVPSVSRCRPTPFTRTSTLPWIVLVPTVVVVRFTVHDPVPPAVVQLGAPSVPTLPASSDTLTTVPSGAFTKPVPG